MSKNDNENMNVLVIITDQQRNSHMSCSGNKLLKTPHMDSIADGGVRFTNYFCNTPICMPNRGSFFTGMLPSEHKTRSNGINLNPELPLLTKVLAGEGYHTCNVGKLHFQHLAPRYNRYRKSEPVSLESIFDWWEGNVDIKKTQNYYGFEENWLANGHGDVMSGHYFEWLKEQGHDMEDYLSDRARVNKYIDETRLPEELYPTTWVANETVNYIERTAKGEYGNKPFFLHCSFPDPHQPVCPPGRYKTMYNPEDVELPANFSDGQKLLEHEFLGKYIKHGFEPVLPTLVDEEFARKFTALTYGSIAMIDDGIGRVLATLEKSGLAENTMVLFLSDHGDYCGDHALVVKGPAHFRSVINPPLIWKVPGLTKSSVSDSLVSTIDIPGTILNLLGVERKKQLQRSQGIDISPILEDSTKRVRDRCLIEHDEELLHVSRKEAYRLRTLVTEQHRLTIYDGFENGDIFDYKSDPGEVNDLWSKDEVLKNQLVEELMREIINVQLKYPTRKSMH